MLEVAVGTGRNLPYYGPAVTSLTGIDLSPGMLAVARGRARELGRDADLQVGNAQSLDFGDAAFDTVVCTISLCNIPDDRAAVAEMYRVLRPGGRLVLLDHVASDRWWMLIAQKLLEQVTRRVNGDYQTRRPLLLVRARGFMVSGLLVHPGLRDLPVLLDRPPEPLRLGRADDDGDARGRHVQVP